MTDELRACPECQEHDCRRCQDLTWDFERDCPAWCPCAMDGHPERTKWLSV